MQPDTTSKLGCGKCGYAVQGISQLRCPECGADLTEVGIVPRGKMRVIVAGILVIAGFSVAVLACALIALRLIQPMLPIHEDRYYSIQIEPLSGEYDEIGIHIDANLVQPASPSPNTNVTVSPSSGPMTTVTMCDPGTKVDVYDIDLFLKFNAFNDQLGSTEVAMSIDPETRQLTWYETPTISHTTKGVFTDVDLLTAFAAYGFETALADVQLEAQQLFTFLIDFMDARHQLTLSAFTSRSYGGGGNTTAGPPWFRPTYIAGWVVLWLIGVAWLLRRSLKRP